MDKKSSFSAVGVSVVVHALMLIGLAMFQLNLMQNQPEVELETVFEDERVQEEFSKDLEVATEIAETPNLVAGGIVATQVGGSGAPAVAQQKIEQSESFEEPMVELNVGQISVPGLTDIGTDLGEAEISGDIGQPVEGYGAALSRITQELTRLMREQKVLVVWLFDESFSLKDDQQEISAEFHKVYEELGIVQKQTAKARGNEEILQTAIFGFGRSVHKLTPEPTSNIAKIRAAIDQIAVDESGEENMCQSITAVIKEYDARAKKTSRRLVVVVVSDESPSDDTAVEDTIRIAQRAKSPIYILGREAIFGYPFARIVWQDPKYNLNHWVQINRGPETAYPEALQFDGFHARWDSFSSGFGPYAQVRISKESGGIFFVLPGEEENLTGVGANEKRKFDFLAMKEYQPLLLSRREYAETRQRSKFRSSLWDIITMLDPRSDSQLNIAVHHYPLEAEPFREYASKEFAKVTRTVTLLSQAVERLEEIKPLRDREDSQRWRANYDLIVAQCLSYRVRLFEYMLAVDLQVRDMPSPKDPKSNEWRVARNNTFMLPDDRQFEDIKKLFGIKATKDEYLAQVEEQKQRAIDQYIFVEKEHPGTPWQRRAEHERRMGFGVAFFDHFHDPRYRTEKFDIPKF